MDRLVEVRYTPNAASPSTYSLFQLFWLGGRLVLYWQTDYPSVTTTRRYVGTDETGRPLDMWTWPASGNASRVWAVDPSAWGFDANKVGPTVFQPLLFAGQFSDSETLALENNGTTGHRAGVVLNGFRTYDPFTGGYLQIEPLMPETRSSYGYVNSSHVENSDSDGRAAMAADYFDAFSSMSIKCDSSDDSGQRSSFAEAGKCIEGQRGQSDWLGFAWGDWGDRVTDGNPPDGYTTIARYRTPGLGRLHISGFFDACDNPFANGTFCSLCIQACLMQYQSDIIQCFYPGILGGYCVDVAAQYAVCMDSCNKSLSCRCTL
jgi:hypothetical protein